MDRGITVDLVSDCPKNTQVVEIRIMSFWILEFHSGFQYFVLDLYQRLRKK